MLSSNPKKQTKNDGLQDYPITHNNDNEIVDKSNEKKSGFNNYREEGIISQSDINPLNLAVISIYNTKRNYISNYLKACKEQLSSKNSIIMGTEACDPDSFISSIVLAIHEQAIPVINMNREIFEAKGDMIYLCTIFNISLDDLIFMERSNIIEGQRTIFFKTTQKEIPIDFSLKLILVDHHKPIKELLDLSRLPDLQFNDISVSIDLIIDHHQIRELPQKANRIYIDADVGSCCTLISKFIGHSLTKKGHRKNKLFDSKDFRKEVAKMLSIPIHLDTSGLERVTTHFDKGEFFKLLKIAKLKESDIKKIVKQIKIETFNDENIKTEIILQKDYKRFQENGIVYGYSTVKYPLKDWIDREERDTKQKKCTDEDSCKSALLIQFEEFVIKNELNFLLVNVGEKDERFLVMVNCPVERELAIKQNFKPLNYKNLFYYKIEIEKTRKVLAPIIEKLLN